MIQKAAITGIFYLLIAAAIYILEKAGPSGPCTPGLGMILMMLMPFIVAVLLVINSIRLYKGDKSNVASILIHLIAIGIFCLQ